MTGSGKTSYSSCRPPPCSGIPCRTLSSSDLLYPMPDSSCILTAYFRYQTPAILFLRVSHDIKTDRLHVIYAPYCLFVASHDYCYISLYFRGSSWLFGGFLANFGIFVPHRIRRIPGTPLFRHPLPGIFPLIFSGAVKSA